MLNKHSFIIEQYVFVQSSCSYSSFVKWHLSEHGNHQLLSYIRRVFRFAVHRDLVGSNFSDQLFITDQTYKRHILEPKNSTLQWNMISAPLEHTLSQSICLNLHEWHPIQNVNACPYEFWLVLDLDQDGWKDYDKFTLRLSWPAYVRTHQIVSCCFRFLS